MTNMTHDTLDLVHLEARLFWRIGLGNLNGIGWHLTLLKSGFWYSTAVVPHFELKDTAR